MNFFSFKMIPSLISVLVFLSSNIFIFQFDIIEVSAAPVLDEESAMKYLAKYGYTKIAEDRISSSNRLSKEDMTEALKEYQKFYNLKVTGKLDAQTLDEMSQPRCGVPDKFPANLREKRYVLASGKWKKDKIMFKMLNTFKNGRNQVPISAIESDFSRALNLWQQYIPIKLQLSNKNGFDPDVSISFLAGRHGVNGQSFDGPGHVLALASLPEGQSFGNAFMHFDADEPWYFQNRKYGPGNRGGFSFLQVATHELGHTLGLKHSSDRNAVMYAEYIPKSDTNFRLSSDDIQGIQAQYRTRKNGDRTN